MYTVLFVKFHVPVLFRWFSKLLCNELLLYIFRSGHSPGNLNNLLVISNSVSVGWLLKRFGREQTAALADGARRVLKSVAWRIDWKLTDGRARARDRTANGGSTLLNKSINHHKESIGDRIIEAFGAIEVCVCVCVVEGISYCILIGVHRKGRGSSSFDMAKPRSNAQCYEGIHRVSSCVVNPVQY